MSEDLVRDLMILATKEPQRMQCKNVAELLHMRQIIYGRRKRFMKENNTDIDAKKAANNTEIRLLDKYEKPISFNRADYQSKLANHDFEPCYLILQPSLWDIRDQLETVLKDKIQAGELPSQINAKQAQEQAIKDAEKYAEAIKPVPSIFEILGKPNLEIRELSEEEKEQERKAKENNKPITIDPKIHEQLESSPKRLAEYITQQAKEKQMNVKTKDQLISEITKLAQEMQVDLPDNLQSMELDELESELTWAKMAKSANKKSK